MKKKKLKSTGLVISLVILAGAVALFVGEICAQNKTYKIGNRGPAGGWIFYDKGNNSGGWRYLESAPKDQSYAEWGCRGKSISGAQGTAIGTGKANTAAIIKNCGESGIAAKVAVAYRGGGKNDWFLPSKDELNLMYNNLHKAGVGGFVPELYWSSSEHGDSGSWLMFFGEGNQWGEGKNRVGWVRPIRAF